MTLSEKQMKKNAQAVQMNAYVQELLEKYKENDSTSAVFIYTKNLKKNEQDIITEIGDLNVSQIGYPSINKDLCLRYVIEDTKRQIEDSVNENMMTKEEGESLFKSIGFLCTKAMIDGFNLKSDDIDLNELKKEYGEVIKNKGVSSNTSEVETENLNDKENS